ncbi:MAG: hypothetical protein WCB05_14095 [Candidatus Sulfotelmatobacter sp.]
MSKRNFSIPAILGVAFLVGASGMLTAQQPAQPAGTPVQLVVSVEPKHGTEVPVVRRDDVIVFEGRDRDQVVDWIPAQGDHAALQLFILIDDSSSSSLGSQLGEIKQFISSQPPTTLIGVAYMQDGTARILQDPTNDHELAAKAMRLPIGRAGANASPYFSLSDLVKRWPATTARREVLMVTDGADRYYGTGDLNDPYVQAAIDDAGRAGIQVSAIYNPGSGHFGHSRWQTTWGQNYLSQLSEETGGEAYYIGMTGSAVSFSPFLEDFGRRLQNQYILSFIPKPQKRSGWQKVRINSEVQGVDLISAGRVYVTVQK